jgi:hypothetical protein
MYKIFFTILILIFGLFFNFSIVSAQENQTEINARILPTVWFSTLSIKDQENIKIYAGIQNNSDINFDGEAIFYIDDEEYSKTTFSSEIDSLKDVSTNWITKPGNYEIQVKISATNIPEEKILVSYESDKIEIKIKREITPEVVQEMVVNTAGSAVRTVDQLANSLADQIESYKQSEIINGSVSSNNSGENNETPAQGGDDSSEGGDVLGAFTEESGEEGEVLGESFLGNNKQLITVFNVLMDVFAFLVRKWRWTLAGLILLILIIKFAHRERE